MPPDEPGAPTPAPRDTGGTATFGSGAEPAGAPDTGAIDGPAPATTSEESSDPRPPAQEGEPPRRSADDVESRRPASAGDVESRRPASADDVESRRPASTDDVESRRPASADDVDSPRPASPTLSPPVEDAEEVAPPRPPSPEPSPSDDPIEPRKVVSPTARRRFLDDPDPDAPKKRPKRQKVRARKVRRIVRHVEPWSVLKISVLFFLSIFLIICVASAVLWNAARSAGAIDDVESFITSLGFGNCEDLEGDRAPTPETTTTIDGSQPQLGGASSTSTTVPETEDELSTIPDEEGKCAEGQVLVGGFKFEDQRIFESFALGGVVLVLSGAAASVVLALLFNLISDLTGGVRVTVLEEDPVPRRSGSPPRAGRD